MPEISDVEPPRLPREATPRRARPAGSPTAAYCSRINGWALTDHEHLGVQRSQSVDNSSHKPAFVTAFASDVSQAADCSGRDGRPVRSRQPRSHLCRHRIALRGGGFAAYQNSDARAPCASPSHTTSPTPRWTYAANASSGVPAGLRARWSRPVTWSAVGRPASTGHGRRLITSNAPAAASFTNPPVMTGLDDSTSERTSVRSRSQPPRRVDPHLGARQRVGIGRREGRLGSPLGGNLNNLTLGPTQAVSVRRTRNRWSRHIVPLTHSGVTVGVWPPGAHG